MPSTPFDDLVAAMARAERQGATDEDEANIARCKALGHAVIDCLAANGRDISCADALKVLAGVMGIIIRDRRLGGPISGALVAMEFCQIILDTATGPQEGPSSSSSRKD